DSYGAYPINLESAAATVRFLGWAMQRNTPRPALVPTVDGNITLEWHTNGMDVEITINPSGASVLCVEDQTAQTGGAEVKMAPDFNSVRKAINKIHFRLTR